MCGGGGGGGEGGRDRNNSVHNHAFTSHDKISDTYIPGYNAHGYPSDPKDMSCVHVWCLYV